LGWLDDCYINSPLAATEIVDIIMKERAKKAKKRENKKQPLHSKKKN
jgi:hypothetical protein